VGVGSADLTNSNCLCIDLCMATKTLSVDEEAYCRLVQARRHSRESFSKVIKRANWNDGKRLCGDLLDRASGQMTDEQLDHLEAAQREDLPPADKWKG